MHAAARGHYVSDSRFGEYLYLETNALGSRRLAESAARAGVRRLVYVSTVKVNGEGSATQPYTAGDPPRPVGAYARSKWLGEGAVCEAAAGTTLEAVIVRPPLVYGPGVGANFLRLLRWVDRGWPIPLAGVDNRRSLIGIWNLCDLLLRLLTHPGAAGRVWMASDGEDHSTPDLVHEIGRAMRRRVRLVSVPVGLLRAAATLTGRSADVSRLCDSLQADITQTRRELGWAPSVALEEGVARTVRWYLQEPAGAAGSRDR